MRTGCIYLVGGFHLEVDVGAPELRVGHKILCERMRHTFAVDGEPTAGVKPPGGSVEWEADNELHGGWVLAERMVLHKSIGYRDAIIRMNTNDMALNTKKATAPSTGA